MIKIIYYYFFFFFVGENGRKIWGTQKKDSHIENVLSLIIYPFD